MGEMKEWWRGWSRGSQERERGWREKTETERQSAGEKHEKEGPKKPDLKKYTSLSPHLHALHVLLLRSNDAAWSHDTKPTDYLRGRRRRERRGARCEG